MKHSILVGSIIIVSISAFAVRATAQGQGAFPQLDFSATEVVTSPNGKATSMKIYRLGDKMRSDMPGGKMHTLMLMGEGKIYMIMPQMCMQMPPRGPEPLEETGTVVRKPVGSDTIDGHPTKIEEITVTPADGRNSVTMKAWEATDLKGLPVRVEMPSSRGTVRMEYKDVDLSPPPESLFTVPQGCRTMPMMPGMPHPGQ
jgi:hypothetical protein